MSRITNYDPIANQLFAQGASQGAGYVNAAADNLRAEQALALRQQAQQFEQDAFREQNRQRLQREARTRGANERIFKLLKEQTPSGDLAMMSQYVGLGPTMGLPSIEQAGSMQLQGMAGQPDVFDRLLMESPDVLQDASPALVELVKDRGGKAAAARIQKINATANTLADRGLAKYARTYIQEAERLGLDPQEKMRPTKEALTIREQERADKEEMLMDRGFRPGTDDWDHEMKRSYKRSLELWNNDLEAKKEKAKAEATAARLAEQQATMGGLGRLVDTQGIGALNDQQRGMLMMAPNVSAGDFAKPTITPEQQAAQDEAAAQNIAALRGVPLPEARAFVALRRQNMVGLDSVPSRQRDTSDADAEKRRDQMWQDAQRLAAAAAEARKAKNDALADQYEARARQLQQQAIKDVAQPSQQEGPMLLSDMEQTRTLQTMKQIIAQFRQQNGRPPTEIELEQLTIQQASQPQSPQ